jgi:hypothetical protein
MRCPILRILLGAIDDFLANRRQPGLEPHSVTVAKAHPEGCTSMAGVSGAAGYVAQQSRREKAPTSGAF